MRIHAHRSPANLPDAIELRIAAHEARHLFERIAGLMEAQRAQRERLGGSFYLDLEIAKCAPPQRRKSARFSVGDESVMETAQLAVGDEIAIALFSILVVERFAVLEIDGRVCAALHFERRVRGDNDVALDE